MDCIKMVVTMNPCKCGFYPDLSKCRCTQPQIRKYLNRISGPFLDRMDLGVEVPRQKLTGSVKMSVGENSAVMRKRVFEARKRQEERFHGSSGQDIMPFWNSQMNRRQLREFCTLSREDENFFESISERMGFSFRGKDKILKVARTLADLDGAEQIGKSQLSEAIAFRTFENRYWGMEQSRG